MTVPICRCGHPQTLHDYRCLGIRRTKDSARKRGIRRQLVSLTTEDGMIIAWECDCAEFVAADGEQVVLL